MAKKLGRPAKGGIARKDYTIYVGHKNKVAFEKLVGTFGHSHSSAIEALHALVLKDKVLQVHLKAAAMK